MLSEKTQKKINAPAGKKKKLTALMAGLTYSAWMARSKKLQDKTKEKLRYEKTVADISYTALKRKNLETFFNESLKIIGENLGFARINILLSDPETKTISVAYQWAKRPAYANIKHLQSVSWSAFPGLVETLKNKGAANAYNLYSYPKSKKERAFFKKEKIKSILVLPIKTSRGLFGFLSIDDCESADKWNGQEVRLAKVLSNIIGQAIDRDFLESKILKSKNHYAQVIDSIQDSICVVDKKNRIASHNLSFARHVGLPIRKIKGLSLENVIYKFDHNLFDKKFFNPQDKANLISIIFKKGLANQIIKKTEKNGKPYYHQISVYPTKNREGQVQFAVLSIRDITQRMVMEEQHRRLSELNQRIIDNVPASIITLDKKGQIISANNHWSKLAGASPAKTIGLNFFKAGKVKKSGLDKMLKKTLKTGRITHRPNDFYTADDGRTYCLDIKANALRDEDGKIDGVISIADDITELVDTQEKLKKSNSALERKVKERTKELWEINKKLEKAIKFRSYFLADASHELRTPLTIIKGYLEMMALEGDSQNKEDLEIITKEVDRISQIVSDVILISRAEIAKESIKKMHREKINLKHLAENIIKELDSIAKKSNIRIISRLNNLSYQGDKDMLEKLIFNLLTNALKYGKERGFVKISLSESAGSAKLVVEDNGVGIPKKALPYIFERFYRADKSRAKTKDTGTAGTGLGLAICKWAVEAHKGSIDVESRLGKGAKFTVILPK